jgi:competence protein ComEA
MANRTAPRGNASAGRPRLARGPVAAFLASRAFVPVGICLGVLLLAGTVLQIAWRFGWTLPQLAPSQGHTVAITGPGVDQSATAIKAYILGAVVQPGVYSLGPQARVQDLVQAAGGLLPDADRTRIDLAARVVDGQEVYVPRVGEDMPANLTGLVNINTATAADMHAALGISLTTAQHIVAYRTAHGPFTSVSQLLLVPISRSIYDRIKYLVTV